VAAYDDYAPLSSCAHFISLPVSLPML
jgi:hypothetical protein